MNSAHTLNESSRKALLWIGRTGGARSYGMAPNYVASERLVKLGLAQENPSRQGQFKLSERGKIAYQFLEDERTFARSGRDPGRGTKSRKWTLRSGRRVLGHIERLASGTYGWSSNFTKDRGVTVSLRKGIKLLLSEARMSPRQYELTLHDQKGRSVPISAGKNEPSGKAYQREQRIQSARDPGRGRR